MTISLCGNNRMFASRPKHEPLAEIGTGSTNRKLGSCGKCKFDQERQDNQAVIILCKLTAYVSKHVPLTLGSLAVDVCTIPSDDLFRSILELTGVTELFACMVRALGTAPIRGRPKAAFIQASCGVGSVTVGRTVPGATNRVLSKGHHVCMYCFALHLEGRVFNRCTTCNAELRLSHTEVVREGVRLRRLVELALAVAIAKSGLRNSEDRP
jgi:hypothetical protein